MSTISEKRNSQTVNWSAASWIFCFAKSLGCVDQRNKVINTSCSIGAGTNWPPTCGRSTHWVTCYHFYHHYIFALYTCLLMIIAFQPITLVSFARAIWALLLQIIKVLSSVWVEGAGFANLISESWGAWLKKPYEYFWVGVARKSQGWLCECN